MASAPEVRRQLHRACRRAARPMRCCSLLVFSLSVVLFLLLGVGNAAAAAGRRAAGGAGGKTKAGLGATGSDIITITSQNFKETVKEGTWFVKFYTDWCRHCQQLQPTWEDLATELKGKVNVGQVNCDRHPSLCRRFHVTGYPMLVHVHNRRTRVYTKSRSKEAMVKYAQEGFKKQAAVSAMKSPFGPLENFKALVVQGAARVKTFVMVQIETGTPMWLVCLSAVAMLVVVTVVVAVVIVNVKRPKQD